MTHTEHVRSARLRQALYTSIVALMLAPLAHALDDEFKIWSEDPKLSWQDFHKRPPERSATAAQSWVGLDVSGMCIDGEFRFEVMAFFDRDSSWVRKVKHVDKLLRHEQGHFDIAEIAARQLRKALAHIPRPCDDIPRMQEQMKTLTRENKLWLNQEQLEYDIQTKHGTDRKKQKKWEERIRKRLQELEAYK